MRFRVLYLMGATLTDGTRARATLSLALQLTLERERAWLLRVRTLGDPASLRLWQESVGDKVRADHPAAVRTDFVTVTVEDV